MADTEPMSRTYNAMPPEGKYPLQRVHHMEGGHTLIVSNDKDNPFVSFFHASGTHSVIRPDGSMDAFCVGTNKSYNKGGTVVSSDHNGDVHVAGHKKVHIEGGGHIEIAGDANIIAAGAVNLAALGGMGAMVKGNFHLACDGAMNINAPSFNVKSGAITLAGDMGFDGNITHAGDMTTSGVHTDSNGKHVG